jgi:hypothetical protein
VTLLTGAEVLSLETGSGGRVVTGVVVSRGGQRAVNPALTAMANAIRVGEHLTDRLA